MKFSSLLILSAVLLYSCGHKETTTTTQANQIVYKTDDVISPELSAKLYLSANPSNGELMAQVNLNNTGDKTIFIQETVISTSDGIRTTPESGDAAFVLKSHMDSTLMLKFRPLNDLKLFQVTGMSGSTKPVYTVSITYKTFGNDKVSTLVLKSNAEKESYSNYTRKYEKPVTGYSFNTKAGFNEKQKRYLQTIKQAGKLPFVYLSEQEIALAGLNFRLKSYLMQDTLHAELFIVNHADFLLKIIPDAFDIVSYGKPVTVGKKAIAIEKISGSQQNPYILEKGDRVAIHFKKYMKTNTPGNDRLSIHLQKAFMITETTFLFNGNVDLLPSISSIQ